jgi:hypothetical protein
MKAELPSENSDSLRELMREWNVTAPLPPRFQEGVWRRIERAESNAATKTTITLWSVLKAWLLAAMPRPAVAVAYVTVLLVTGMAAGYTQARNQSARLDHELGMRYVQSVDPYQKTPRL